MEILHYWNKVLLNNFWFHFVNFFLGPTVGSECYTNALATDYRGFTTYTVSGRTCQPWNSQLPHQHWGSNTHLTNPNEGLGAHQYCRNPDNMSGGVWCYTTDAYKRWEYCDVGAAKTSCPGAGKLIATLNVVRKR